MRSYRYQLLRSVLLTLLVVLLIACAGSDSKASSPSVDEANLPAQNGPGSAGGVNQQDEPLAALVNGQPITLAEFERERARQSLGMVVEPADMTAFDAYVLQIMIEQMLIVQAAEGLDIVVTEEEIDAELEEQARIATEMDVSLEDFVATQLYTMDEYRDAMRTMLLSQKISQAVVNVSTTTVQVHPRHILVTDENTAYALLSQLDQGADFAELARQYSLDKTTAANGGDLSWVSQGDLLQSEVERVIFSMAPFTRYPIPVKSSLGYHVIEVFERVEDRPLSEAALAEKKQQAFVVWLQNQVATAEIERYVGVGQ